MAKYLIQLEVEVDTDDMQDAHELAKDMVGCGLLDSAYPLHDHKVINTTITMKSPERQFPGISPSAMGAKQIVTGSRLYGHDKPVSTGRFQLTRTSDWNALLRRLPTEAVRDAFLSSITAVWIHADHSGWCWVQTSI